jgi:hypothetical protein
MAELALERGDPHRAAGLAEESLVLLRRVGHQERVARSLLLLARALKLGGDQERAAARFRESLATGQEAGDGDAVAAALVGLAQIAVAEGAATRAARLLGAAEAFGATRRAALTPPEAAWRGACHAALAEQLPPGAIEAAMQQGRIQADAVVSQVLEQDVR